MDSGAKRYPGFRTIPEQIRMSAFIHLVHAFLLSAAAGITIDTSAEFGAQRPCLRYCMKGTWDIGWYLGCGSPILDSCYCREDLQSSAIHYISACVTTGCQSNTVDVSIGVSLYTSYCSITAPSSQTKTASLSSRKTSTVNTGPANTGGASSGGSGGSSGSGSSSGSGGDTNVNTNNINIGGALGSSRGGNLAQIILGAAAALFAPLMWR